MLTMGLGLEASQLLKIVAFCLIQTVYSIQSSFRELRDTLFITITYELRIKLIGTDQKTCYESHILQGFGVNYSKQLTLAWIL